MEITTTIKRSYAQSPYALVEKHLKQANLFNDFKDFIKKVTGHEFKTFTKGSVLGYVDSFLEDYARENSISLKYTNIQTYWQKGYDRKRNVKWKRFCSLLSLSEEAETVWNTVANGIDSKDFARIINILYMIEQIKES